MLDFYLLRGDGALIITGATASLRGKPFTTAFAPGKAAQRSLAQSLARQYGKHGVHVALVIVDGMVDLPGNRERMPDTPREAFVCPGARHVVGAAAVPSWLV